MESDVRGEGAWYHHHDQVVSSYNNPLSAPLQDVDGNPSHIGKACQGVMFLEDKSIGNGNIEEEMENVLIKLPASSPTAIIPSHLISIIYAAHVLVIANDSRGAYHLYPTTILF